MSAIALCVGRHRAQHAGGGQRLVQNIVCADDVEALLAQHLDHRGQRAVVAGEGGAAGAGQQARPLGIRPQIEEGRPPHGADQHQVTAPVRPQRGQYPPRGANSDHHVRPGRQHGGLGEAVEADHEHRPPRGGSRRRDPAGQPAAAGENPQRRPHPRLRGGLAGGHGNLPVTIGWIIIDGRHPSPHVKDACSMTRDDVLANISASAGGIIHCLHLLAEDAARLGLARTHLAICEVLEICEAERTEHAARTTPAPGQKVQ